MLVKDIWNYANNGKGKMKIMNQGFGNRLLGFNWGIYIMLVIDSITNSPSNYTYLACILTNIVIVYFFIFGVSRFTPDYRKIL